MLINSEGIRADSQEVVFPAKPYAPEGTRGMLEHTSLSSIKEALSSAEIDPQIKQSINSMIEDWRHEPETVEPYTTIRNVLEEIRKVPHGDRRIELMNSVVRTLGRPDTLATYLDMLRDSATRNGTKEQEICHGKLQAVKMHSIYGWCGNTLMVESFDDPTEGTYRPIPGIGERLENSTSVWNLTVHVWQPNLSAKGFPASPALATGIILEPPHSHPFEFVSTVVKGGIHQSIYAQDDSVKLGSKNDALHKGYYSQTPLEHVDGVWPPHNFRETTMLKTLEHRVPLNAGDSYYMPCDLIHDVEVDKALATSTPAITVFMSSEYLVMPHVYMTPAMADFHRKNPNIKKNGAPIPEKAWHDKLQAISAYLRGESETLDLTKIVGYSGEYAFFHVSQ